MPSAADRDFGFRPIRHAGARRYGRGCLQRQRWRSHGISSAHRLMAGQTQLANEALATRLATGIGLGYSDGRASGQPQPADECRHDFGPDRTCRLFWAAGFGRLRHWHAH